MSLPISNLKEWNQIKTGSATISISGDGRMASFDGIPGSGAQITKNLIISPGSLCVVSFSARAVRGEGNVWIHDKDTQTNRQQVLSESWERYKITACPKVFSNIENSYFRINIGIASSNDGAIDVADVSVEILGGSVGPIHTLAAGSVTVNSGSPGVLSNIVGLYGVSISSDGYNLEVSVPKLSPSVKTPIVLCNRVEGSGSETPGQWVPRNYDKTAGLIRFRFFEPNSSSPKSISSINSAFTFSAQSV